MNRMYFILSVAGWAWLIVVATFLVLRLWIVPKRQERVRGFDVVGQPRPADAGPGDAGAKA